MLPRPARVRLRLVCFSIVVAACGAGAATPAPDPAGPCAGADEQRTPGFYPDLEAHLPGLLDGRAPARVDSGRYCSSRTLGSLLMAGVAELHFAGATWPEADGSGIALVVYEAPGLTVDAVADSFAVGAGSARGISQVHAREMQVAGRRGVSISAVSDRRPQAVLIWPAATEGLVNVAIASGAVEDRMAAAVDAFGDR